LDFDFGAFENAVASAQVTMMHHALFVNDKERDAVNHPSEKTIEVNRDNWIHTQPVVKVELVFHEYLGIAGIERDIYTVSRTLMQELGPEEMARIAAASAPVLNYHCVIKHTNAEHSVNQTVCGEVDLSTSDSPTRPMAAYFHECDRMEISVMKWAGLGAGLQVQLRQIANGPADSWRNRRPEAYSSFELDLYSAPTALAISLGIQKGGLFSHTEQYWAECTKN
jgi:hypothetical protein